MIVALAGCSGRSATTTADRVDVRVEVTDDGSVLVSESMLVRPDSGGGTVERLVDVPRADRFAWVAAAVDGQSLDDGRTVGGVRFSVEDGGLLRARWTFDAPASAGPHTLALTYRAEGGLFVSGRRGSLVWPFLPRGLRIGEARVELVVPDGVQLLRGTGIAEAGWIVEATSRGIIGARTGVGEDPGTLLAELPIDASRVPLPAWQVTEDLRTQFAPAFVAGALFFLVIGAGVLWLIQLRRTSRPPADAAEADRRAMRLPPALAVRVARGRGAIADALAAAAVRRLLGDAATGSGDASWRHQSILADWHPGGTPEDLAALARLRPAFSTALEADCESAGLVDRERAAIRSGLWTTAWVSGAFSLACAGLAALALGRFGWWAQLIPGAMLTVAALFAVASRRLSLASRLGDRAGTYWRDRLARVSREAPSAEAGAIVWALAAGEGERWMQVCEATLPEPVRTFVNRWLAEVPADSQ